MFVTDFRAGGRCVGGSGQRPAGASPPGPADQIAAFEQDLLAAFVLARSSAGITDAPIRADVAAVEELREWFGRPLWEVTPQHIDTFFGRYLSEAMPGTKVRKAAGFAVYFEFLELRHKPDIHAVTGFVVGSRWTR